jgi:hypothetical protein
MIIIQSVGASLETVSALSIGLPGSGLRRLALLLPEPFIKKTGCFWFIDRGLTN